MKKIMLLAATLVIAATAFLASPGRTNKDGCHTNRLTGVYHCH